MPRGNVQTGPCLHFAIAALAFDGLPCSANMGGASQAAHAVMGPAKGAAAYPKSARRTGKNCQFVWESHRQVRSWAICDGRRGGSKPPTRSLAMPGDKHLRPPTGHVSRYGTSDGITRGETATFISRAHSGK
ncbi:hypothetical protein B0T11DRAFT_299146 [Plectosphaerella cucumerina]|uniref:Uncharacterized protein n=1 Tax=Plectosphaerella cucumerina TaxID=40658 RepID=A0A8K0T806_9PEZI|nr:hypothetical protein B0T11DRAFT_299146 [Plectosphaerella cucumerina]